MARAGMRAREGVGRGASSLLLSPLYCPVGTLSKHKMSKFPLASPVSDTAARDRKSRRRVESASPVPAQDKRNSRLGIRLCRKATILEIHGEGKIASEVCVRSNPPAPKPTDLTRDVRAAGTQAVPHATCTLVAQARVGHAKRRLNLALAAARDWSEGWRGAPGKALMMKHNPGIFAFGVLRC